MRMSSPPRGAFSHGLSTGSHSSGRSIREVTDCTGSSMLERPQLEGKCLGALRTRSRIDAVSLLITPPAIKTKSNVLSTRK